MPTSLAHTWYMTLRQLRNLMRQPWYIALTLFQPIIYLLLFGALFAKVVEIPGFGSASYISFLAPGVVVMTALFSAGWTGMGMVNDLDRGVMDRFLITPVRRGALMMGTLVQLAVVIVIQAAIILGLALLRGASFPGGLAGVAVVVLAAILLAAPFGALSNGVALLVRKEETVIAAVNFVLLPLIFLSGVFMAQSLMPHWMQSVARVNPVNWAVTAGRAAVGASVDWGVVWSRLGLLAGFALVCALLATQAFRVYQRSI